jgi:hypothetical protein
MIVFRDQKQKKEAQRRRKDTSSTILCCPENARDENSQFTDELA